MAHKLSLNFTKKIMFVITVANGTYNSYSVASNLDAAIKKNLHDWPGAGIMKRHRAANLALVLRIIEIL